MMDPVVLAVHGGDLDLILLQHCNELRPLFIFFVDGFRTLVHYDKYIAVAA